ncbi:MAG: NAD-dependent malic enzyme [Proteobacteria bacterium]|nr:NAD-dependent malic enzyme [Pseudomonadota bacterium]
MSIEKYQKWRDQKGKPFIPVSLDGLELIADRNLNKGTAFTKEERKIFHLEGLIPPSIATFEEQKARVYEGYSSAPTDIDKYIYLRSLQDRNETLFYGLLEEYVEEMIPIVYIPTVGIACEQFSHHYQRSRGLYITKENIGGMEEMVHHFPSQEIRIIVVTDSQGILGIGDIGVGGMAIPIGKLALYSVGAGIHPSYCLPIALDIGTDNEELLADPLYLGVGHKRIRGAEYDEFLDEFVHKIKQFFPRAILQWEDFSKNHSFKILKKYRETLPSYNDDIQSTGAVVMAGIINAMKIKQEKLTDQVFTIFGAGSGGIGFARQLHSELVNEGLDAGAASDKIILMDSKGVVFSDRDGLEEFKRPFAKDPSVVATWESKSDAPTLLDVLENTGSTVLVGISGQNGAFTEQHVQAMLKSTDRPVILPLTNPSDESEATPEDLFQWTGGRAIMAVGSQYPDVEYEGTTYRIGQGSNSFIFPGLGMAAFISRIKVITEDMFMTAAHALAGCVPKSDLDKGTIYPRVKDLQNVAVRIAVEVLKVIVKRNPDIGLKNENIHEVVRSNIWKPMYHPYKRV